MVWKYILLIAASQSARYTERDGIQKFLKTTMPFTSRFISLFIDSKSKNILSAWANTHMRKHVNAVEPELERYAGLVQQLKGKNREWKNLLA